MKQSIGAQPLAYPLPVYLVGTYDGDGRANIMNAAWGGICNSEPPCLAVSVRHARHTFAALMERKAFTVSIPNSRIAVEADYAGIASGRKVDKFAAAALTPVRSELVDAPYVAECPVVIEMKLVNTVELGSHMQFIGEILDVKVDASCLGEDGKPDIARIDPILFDGGGKMYHRVGEAVAQAFSAGKRFLRRDQEA